MAVVRVGAAQTANRTIPFRIGDAEVALRQVEKNLDSLVALAERVAEVLGWRPAHSDLPNIVDTAWHWQLKRKKVSL